MTKKDLLSFISKENQIFLNVLDIDYNNYEKEPLLRTKKYSNEILAKIVYYFINENIKIISSTESNFEIWYLFDENKKIWTQTNSRYNLFKNYIQIIKKEITNCIHELERLLPHHYILTGLIFKIIRMLKNIYFYKVENEKFLLQEIFIKLKELLTDNHFIEKLNPNQHYLCFTNGIFDLEQNIFRPTLKNDYSTLCFNYNYERNIFISLNKSFKYVVMDIVENFFLNNDLKINYFFLFLSSLLSKSKSKNQKIDLWLTLDRYQILTMLKCFFGDYVLYETFENLKGMNCKDLLKYKLLVIDHYFNINMDNIFFIQSLTPYIKVLLLCFPADLSFIKVNDYYQFNQIFNCFNLRQNSKVLFQKEANYLTYQLLMDYIIQSHYYSDNPILPLENESIDCFLEILKYPFLFKRRSISIHDTNTKQFKEKWILLETLWILQTENYDNLFQWLPFEIVEDIQTLLLYILEQQFKKYNSDSDSDFDSDSDSDSL